MTEVPAQRMRTRSEIANLLGVSEKTLREWERTGTGPQVVRFSPKVARYPADAVSRFISTRGELRCA